MHDFDPARSTHVEREIRSQPETWRTALSMLPDLAAGLPRSGERVAVIGCGTSWFVAQAYAMLREQSGHGETDSFTASQFPTARRYDRVVAISRSGTTTEVIRAIEACQSPVTAIVAVRDTAVVSSADAAIVLDFADEQSVVQTVFATTALMILRACLGESVEPVVDQAAAVLSGEHALATAAADAAQYSFLGQGWVYGIAQEAALKMREAAQLWTEAYVQMEYRHGPISVAEPGRATWVFGPPVDGLREDIAATGAALVDDDLDPVADLVRAQLLALRRAVQNGLDPDNPRHLTRSVVLSD